MNYTQNYQLNQWDAADRVLREDFNSDNRKIDAAIAALQDAIRYVPIAEATLNTAGSRLSLNVSGIDWSSYLKAELFVSGHAAGSSMTLLVNNQTTGYYSSGAGTGSTGSAVGNGNSLATWLSRGNAAVGLVEFPTPQPGAAVTCFNAAAAASGSSLSYSTGVKIAPITWSQLQTFDLTGNLAAGCRMCLYGVRA